MANVVVALDIGTANSGACFSFGPTEDVQSVDLEGMGSAVKTTTCLRLSGRAPYELLGFGESAFHEFDEDNGDLLFDNFKMYLYSGLKASDPDVVDENSSESRVKKNVTTMVPASIGKGEVPVKLIIQRCIEALSSKALEAISLTFEQPDPHDFMWVLTVPAIWNEHAKFLMRDAAYDAGIINSPDSNKLQLAPEPESAAICAADERPTGLFNSGTVFAVMDCGGGTIDTTVYKVEQPHPNLQLQQLMKSEGNDYGSKMIDKAFIGLLKKIFGLKFKEIPQPDLWSFMHQSWEGQKVNYRRGQAINVNIASLLPYLRDEKHSTLQSWLDELSKRKPQIKDLLGVRGKNNLLIQAPLIAKVFGSAIQGIRELFRDLVKLLEDHGINLDFLVLAGGFSASSLVQDVLKEELEKAFPEGKLITVLKPSMAIAIGAVKYAYLNQPKDEPIPPQPDERSIASYGIESMTNNPKHFPAGFQGDMYAHHLSRIIKGEKSHIGSTKQKQFQAVDDSAQVVALTIWKTYNHKAKSTEDGDVTQLGKVNIDVEPSSRIVTVEFELTKEGLRMYRIKSDGEKALVEIEYTC